MNKYTEVPEAKSLRWLAFVFPKIENPADDCDRMTNCIHLYCTNAAKLIEQQRDELIEQEYTLTGVMHSVDKWLDGDELEQDEVNRAITMREKTLRIIETIKTDTAKAIFEEIDEGFDKIAIVATNDTEYCGFDGVCRQVFEAVDDVLAELKKKYVHDNPTVPPDIDVNH